MVALNRRSIRRLAAIVAGITLIATVLLLFATRAARAGKEQLSILARTEIQADNLARDFRRQVDEMNTLLLNAASLAPGEAKERSNRMRIDLQKWVKDRRADGDDIGDSQILNRLSRELADYFSQSDALIPPPDAIATPPSGETVKVLAVDETSVRVQKLADEYANLHMDRLKQTLQGSLESLMLLRWIVFACLVLLAGGLTGLGYLLYRDFVLPLRLTIVDRELALRRGEKLAALGTLAAGVAHEIRNPLTAMKARLFALRHAPIDPTVREDLSAIQHDVERLERIVRDVLEFAHPGEPRFSNLELAAWVKKTATYLRPEMERAGITVETEDDGPILVRADEDRLFQVALNLTRNSLQALNGKPGEIVLAARHDRTDKTAVLSISDNGPGIPGNVRERLFDPFFTTRSSGTGLGLAIVAKIVDQHGGRIALQTAPAGGTRFEIYLPLASDSSGDLDTYP